MKQPLVLLLYVMTFTSGLVDAVSILGLNGVFTSLMTGNTVLIGLSLGGGAEVYSAFRSSLAIASFLVGAVLAGRWAKLRMDASRRAWLLPVAFVESGLLLAAAVTGHFISSGNAPTDNAILVMIALTAMAMGLRSATIQRLSVGDLKATVLTLTLTGLAADSPLGGNRSQNVYRRIASIALLCSGATLGASLFNRYGVPTTLIESTWEKFIGSIFNQDYTQRKSLKFNNIIDRLKLLNRKSRISTRCRYPVSDLVPVRDKLTIDRAVKLVIQNKERIE